tara:strand:- start:3332 stop:4081 length:750 start_codon:yes stop_codon:yes gene_type:complete
MPKICLKSNSTIYHEITSGMIPAIIVPKILSKSDCLSISNKISQQQLDKGNYFSYKIGTSLSAHIYDKKNYFENAFFSNQLLEDVFDGFSPIQQMKDKISEIFKKQIFTANENTLSYSDAVIRVHNENDKIHLHRDNTNFEMPDYSVSRLKNQLSAILYLQEPQSGGSLKIFQRFWKPEDEKMRIPNFGYSEEIVNNFKSVNIFPSAGSMIIINPNFFHLIQKITGGKKRISLGFFFGQKSINKLLSWA